jgi:hypothetical protein
MSWGKVVTGVCVAATLGSTIYFLYKNSAPDPATGIPEANTISSEIGDLMRNAPAYPLIKRKEILDGWIMEITDLAGAYPEKKADLARIAEDLDFARTDYKLLDRPNGLEYYLNDIQKDVKAQAPVSNPDQDYEDYAITSFLGGSLATFFVWMICYTSDDDWY